MQAKAVATCIRKYTQTARRLFSSFSEYFVVVVNVTQRGDAAPPTTLEMMTCAYFGMLSVGCVAVGVARVLGERDGEESQREAVGGLDVSEGLDSRLHKNNNNNSNKMPGLVLFCTHWSVCVCMKSSVARTSVDDDLLASS